uniref:Exonuclease 3'-5' domain-containing protein 1 n=1 Tax=Magallana gigas TaxID=29159 RepID=A0A8W8KZW4_MAGGI
MANPAVEIVVETRRCHQVVSILSRESVLVVDCEGIALGVEGPMTLLQICTYSGDVYLFDVQENQELFSEGHLKIVLESDEILIVADTVLKEHKGRLLVSSLDLQALCQKYSSCKKVSAYKEQIKIQYSKKEGCFWAKRPLTDEMKSVAIGEVRALIPEVFETQKRLIENNVLQEKFHKRVSRTVKFYIDDEVRKQRFQRKIDIVNEIIDSIDEKWDADNTFSDISNDSDEFEALKEIEYTEAGKKSAFINRLKTESIMSDLNELDDNITRGERNYEVKWITFSSLTKLCDHPNATVSRLAKDVKYKLKDIKSEEIGEKYGIEAELKHLTKCEKDVLRSLNIKDTDDQRFSKNVERLYWLLTKHDIDNNCEKKKEMSSQWQHGITNE